MAFASRAHLQLRAALRVPCLSSLTRRQGRPALNHALYTSADHRTQKSLSTLPSQRLTPRKLVRCLSATADTAELIEQKNAANDIVIYSKSYCPFSGQVKDLFHKLKVDYKSFELDEIVEGDDVLDTLMDKTSSRTVPQVFIKGQYIGGCDETMSQYRSGKLQQVFEQAGISASF